jgi:tripartite-type tricarboxylate transporter receptor subunit TctC
MTSQPYIFAVHPSVAANTVAELVTLSKQPKSVNFGSSGTGGLSHLAGAMLNLLGNANMVHVPYKGGGPLLSDVLAGHIDAGFPTPLEGLSHIKAGRLRPLAVTTTRRMSVLPDVPTMAETGVAGYEVNGWYGVLAPAGTPEPILDKLNESILEALRAPDVIATFARDGVTTVGSTRSEFGAHVRSEVNKWKRIVQEAGIRKD